MAKTYKQHRAKMDTIINRQNVLSYKKKTRDMVRLKNWKGAPVPTTMDRLHGATWLPMGANIGLI